MFEVEIKSLLQTKENADQLRENLEDHDRRLEHHGSHSQLNHYFTDPEDPRSLENVLSSHVPESSRDDLHHVLETGDEYSIRSREADGQVLVVIKASVGKDTSANGVSRIEFEEPVDMSLNELDELLLDAGLEYKSKWSREREEYSWGDLTVTIDRNAGYGYLAEFEIEIEDEKRVQETESEIRELMNEVGAKELSQDRIERMFEHYNNNWQDYYGTDKVFSIE